MLGHENILVKRIFRLVRLLKLKMIFIKMKLHFLVAVCSYLSSIWLCSHAIPRVNLAANQRYIATFSGDIFSPQHIFSPMRFHRSSTLKGHHKAKRRHSLHSGKVFRRCTDFFVKTSPNCRPSKIQTGLISSLQPNAVTSAITDNGLVTAGNNINIANGLSSGLNTNIGPVGYDGNSQLASAFADGAQATSQPAPSGITTGCDDLLVKTDPYCQGTIISGATVVDKGGSRVSNGHHVQIASNQFHDPSFVHLQVPGQQMVQPGKQVFDRFPMRHYKASFAPVFQEKGLPQIIVPSTKVYATNKHVFQQGQTVNCNDAKISDVNDNCETPSVGLVNQPQVLGPVQNSINNFNQEIQAMSTNQGFGTSAGMVEGRGNQDGDFPMTFPATVNGQARPSGEFSNMQMCNFNPCTQGAYSGDRYQQQSEVGLKASQYGKDLALPKNPFLRRYIPKLLHNIFQKPERRHNVKHLHAKKKKHAKHSRGKKY